jgi:CubicO group peptidase (beta-lactamase class C family)
VTPARAGWDPRGLAAVLAYARDHASRGVVVLHRGRLLAEGYWRGADAATTRDVASAQKSVTSFLVGIAVARHGLDARDRVSTWLGAGWSRAPRAQEARITVRHLLTMTSGLDDDLRRVAAPGSAWRYANAPYHVLHPVLEAVTGRRLQAFSKSALFGPLGMGSARWAPRPEPEEGTPARRHPWMPGEQGLVMTPRDMARFGLFVLAGARWNSGPRLVPAAYRTAALSTSQELNPAYGYLWWLNGKASFLVGADPRPRPRSIVPSAPADLVAALGAADQKIYVVPSLELVVVRQGARGGAPMLSADSFDQGWWKLLSAAAPR